MFVQGLRSESGRVWESVVAQWGCKFKCAVVALPSCSTSFFYDGYYGSVNTCRGEEGPHPKSKAPWRPVVDLHVRDRVLTFDVNGVPQPGSWLLPTTCYLLACPYHAGSSLRVSSVWS